MWQTNVTLSVSVLTGLLLQLTALALVHVTVKGQWLRHSGAMLLAMACVYHGFTELLQFAFPGRNKLRASQMDQQLLDQWMLLVSAALLVYAIGYVAVLRGKPAPAKISQSVALGGLQVKWLLLLCLPLVVLSARGKGATQVGAIGSTADRSNYAVGGLALQFLVFLCALTGIVIISRFGGRWMLPVLVVQSTVLALVGVRSMIVLSALLILFGVTALKVRYSKRTLAAAFVFIAIASMAISSARAIHGREAFMANHPASERLSVLADGLISLPSASNAILNDVVYRFDANVFGAHVVDALDRGAEPVGLVTLRNDAALAVPSFLNPNKLSSSVADRNEETYFDLQFGMDPETDYLPGLWGFLPGYFGKGGMFVLSMLLGAALGGIDRWLAASPSRTRFLVSVGLMQSILLYESLPVGFLLNGRGVLVFVLLVGAIAWARHAARGSGRHDPRSTSYISRQAAPSHMNRTLSVTPAPGDAGALPDFHT